jgi:hypothetical protein
MTEEDRYATVQQQMQEISDRAATFHNPVIGILSAQLYAEMYARNERHHMRVVQAREGFVQILEALVKKRKRTIISVAWQTSVMPVPAYDYFHAECEASHEFKSEAIKNGARRELSSEDIATFAVCSHCYGKLKELPS